MRRFLLVGLTGSIATGKSTVSRMFAHLGARVIDADLLAREVVMPGQAAFTRIVEEFGSQVVQGDGSLDRKALGALVFGDPAKRKRLEEITHPAIGARQQRMLSALDEELFEGVVLWDAALLFEGGGAAKMDRVVVVYNHYVSPLTQTVVVEDVLPVPRTLLDEEEHKSALEIALEGDFIYEPEPEQILERLLPTYLETTIYRALLESAASEHGARMTAMRNATKNAGELIDRLTLDMNRARQAEITQEILEVVAGADALTQ